MKRVWNAFPAILCGLYIVPLCTFLPLFGEWRIYWRAPLTLALLTVLQLVYLIVSLRKKETLSRTALNGLYVLMPLTLLSLVWVASDAEIVKWGLGIFLLPAVGVVLPVVLQIVLLCRQVGKGKWVVFGVSGLLALIAPWFAFLSLFGFAAEENLVHQTISSPGEEMYAAVESEFVGMHNTNLVVKVYYFADTWDLGVCTIEKEPQTLYSEFEEKPSSVEVYWQDEYTLCINDKEYVLY